MSSRFESAEDDAIAVGDDVVSDGGCGNERFVVVNIVAHDELRDIRKVGTYRPGLETSGNTSFQQKLRPEPSPAW